MQLASRAATAPIFRGRHLYRVFRARGIVDQAAGSDLLGDEPLAFAVARVLGWFVVGWGKVDQRLLWFAAGAGAL